MGYDPLFVTKKESRLFVFSRGRLMSTNTDFRKLLGLKNYEADFQQGLTVIVEDIHCQLTLDPTKEGFRDCQSLWQTMKIIVNAYYNLGKRLCGAGSNKQRHNLLMQGAINAATGKLAMHYKKDMQRLNDLQLNVLPLPGVKARATFMSTGKASFGYDLKSIIPGVHTVYFDALTAPRPMKTGYSLEPVAQGAARSGGALEHNLFTGLDMDAAETGRASSRSSRERKKSTVSAVPVLCCIYWLVC